MYSIILHSLSLHNVGNELSRLADDRYSWWQEQEMEGQEDYSVHRWQLWHSEAEGCWAKSKVEDTAGDWSNMLQKLSSWKHIFTL